MENFKSYIISIIICALSCRIVSQIVSNTRRKALMHFVSGTLLAIFILRPLSHIDPEALWEVPELDQFSAAYYITEGEKAAIEAQEKSIKDACETYILDKATTLGAKITVHFSLNEELMPLFAEISSDANPDVQMQLENILMTDLGIPKENQKWIWNQESSNS